MVKKNLPMNDQLLKMLLVLLTLIGTGWVWCFKLLRDLGLSRDNYSYANVEIFGLGAMMLSFFLFALLWKVVWALYHQTRKYKIWTSNYNDKQDFSYNEQRAKELYSQVLSQWYWGLAILIPPLLAQVTLWLPSVAALIVAILFGAALLFIYLWLIDNLGISSYIETLALFVLYFVFIVVATSGVQINLDDDTYQKGDPVKVAVVPYGFILPRIVNVTYFNENVLLKLDESEPFRASRRYLTIPGDMLVEQGYNSHVIVEYTHFNRGFLGIGKYIKGAQLKSVPVYPLRNDTNDPSANCEVYQQNLDCTYNFST